MGSRERVINEGEWLWVYLTLTDGFDCGSRLIICLWELSGHTFVLSDCLRRVPQRGAGPCWQTVKEGWRCGKKEVWSNVGREDFEWKYLTLVYYLRSANPDRVINECATFTLLSMFRFSAVAKNVSIYETKNHTLTVTVMSMLITQSNVVKGSNQQVRWHEKLRRLLA